LPSRSTVGGTRIARDGASPLDIAGGPLGAGCLHGFGIAHEAVTHLRRAGGERQIPGNREAALATSEAGRLRRRCCWRAT